MEPKTRQRLIYAAAGVVAIGAILFVSNRPKPAVVVAPQKQDVVEVVVASGRIRAIRQSQVGAEVSGVVDSLEVAEGDTVKAGQLLGRLRLGETDARLAQAQAALRAAEVELDGEESQLARARLDLRRATELEARKLVPTSDLDEAQSAERFQSAKASAARARLAQARAQVEQVRPEFGKREIRAPFDGVVIQRLVEPGTAVSPSTGWFQIAEMSATEIYVETDENNLGKLAVGQTAIAVAPAYPDRPFAARLAQVGPNVDSDRGVVGLRLVATQLPDFVLPNMTIDVNIEVKRTAAATALPASAVSTQGEPYVLAVDAGGTLERRPVDVVGRNPEWIAVKGLPTDATVVKEIRTAKPGERIRPMADEGPRLAQR